MTLVQDGEPYEEPTCVYCEIKPSRYWAALSYVIAMDDELCELRLRVLAMEAAGDRMAKHLRFVAGSDTTFQDDWDMAKDAKS